ncbi:F-box domain containing protein [Brugia malayi]|uniref:F-box domain containing protein n=1 Tax=Brugia malayi TaxID=6279 RepID=A0A4E9FXD9_BRUMA|nr:F-box domain containing protein [Brugia malayi]VIO97563.1 F-box domain containing protein [Brugia malayi]
MDAITESPGRHRPLSHKYDTIDRRYKFFEATRVYRLQTYYPLVQLGRSSYSATRRKNRKSKISTGSEMEIDQITTDSEFIKVTHTTINDLSNDILLTIFAYCHPIDLIHCFSLVCHRWNYLANHSTFFTEVRVLVNDNSLKYGSVKSFFYRTSQYLRKLCIDCSVPLPSTEVNALFDICFPNVIHLDIGSFKEMNTTLLTKLSNSFPNVKTLHMERVRQSPGSDSPDEWKKTLEMLFEDENIFPEVRNFFVGNVSVYSSENDPRLPAYKRPLNLLHIYDGVADIDFSMIRVSPWRYTLTELHLGSYIRNDGIEYIGHLHSLKVFSWGLSLYTFDEEFAHIKNLYNLEELRVWFGGQDCNVTPEGLITLFTLPQNEPEKSFPYKLKHLVISNYLEGTVDLFRVIDQNCPNLRTLGLPFNDYLPFNDGVMPFIVSNFKRLFFLDLSNFGDHYKDEVWDNLDDRNLPDLRLLILHGNKVNVENLRRLNLKRPKLLISTKWNYFINWTQTENGCIFHDSFNGDIRAVENDLRQIDGLRDFVINPRLSVCDNNDLNVLARSSSAEFYIDHRKRSYSSDHSV